MRLALAVPLIAACGFALPVLAQPVGPPSADHVQRVSTATPPAQAKQDNPEAAAALAIAIRQREAQERLAQIACNAGDTSKCQPENPPTTAKTPSP